MGQYLPFNKRKAEALAKKMAKEAERAKAEAEERAWWNDYVRDHFAKQAPAQTKAPKIGKSKEKQVRDELNRILVELRAKWIAHFEEHIEILNEHAKDGDPSKWSKSETFIAFIGDCRSTGHGFRIVKSMSALHTRWERLGDEYPHISREFDDQKWAMLFDWDQRKLKIRMAARKLIKERFTDEHRKLLLKHWQRERAQRRKKDQMDDKTRIEMIKELVNQIQKLFEDKPLGVAMAALVASMKLQMDELNIEERRQVIGDTIKELRQTIPGSLQ